MLDQSSPSIMAQNHLWGVWAKATLPQPLTPPCQCAFSKICRGCTKCSKFLCRQPLRILARFRLKNRDGRHLSWLVVCTNWTALRRAHMPRSAVRVGAIQVIVGVVLLMSMASCRQAHTMSRFVCMPVGCERQGRPWRVSTPVWHAASSSDARGHVARMQ